MAAIDDYRNLLATKLGPELDNIAAALAVTDPNYRASVIGLGYTNPQHAVRGDVLADVLANATHGNAVASTIINHTHPTIRNNLGAIHAEAADGGVLLSHLNSHLTAGTGAAAAVANTSAFWNEEGRFGKVKSSDLLTQIGQGPLARTIDKLEGKISFDGEKAVIEDMRVTTRLESLKSGLITNATTKTQHGKELQEILREIKDEVLEAQKEFVGKSATALEAVIKHFEATGNGMATVGDKLKDLTNLGMNGLTAEQFNNVLRTELGAEAAHLIPLVTVAADGTVKFAGGNSLGKFEAGSMDAKEAKAFIAKFTERLKTVSGDARGQAQELIKELTQGFTKQAQAVEAAQHEVHSLTGVAMRGKPLAGAARAVSQEAAAVEKAAPKTGGGLLPWIAAGAGLGVVVSRLKGTQNPDDQLAQDAGFAAGGGFLGWMGKLVFKGGQSASNAVGSIAHVGHNPNLQSLAKVAHGLHIG